MPRRFGRGKKKVDAEIDSMMSGDVEPEAQPADQKDEHAQQWSTIEVDYQKNVKAVRELATLTQNPAWQRFYAGLQSKKRAIKDTFDTLEKSRDIVKAQMKIKAITEILAEVKAPVDALMLMATNYSLFGPLMKTRASWDENSGRVTIVENS